jgi:cytochrome c oxidase cbb3-type subunit 3
MFLQNFMHKKIAVTALLLVTGFTLPAQDSVAKTVPAQTNLLAILLVATVIVLAFVIWGMGQALVALSRQLLDKNKNALPVPIIVLLTGLSLLSQNIQAQSAAADGVAKVIPDYGGLSANTFYLLFGVIATEVCTILFLVFSIRRIYSELVPAKAAVALKDSKLAAIWARLDKRLFTKAIPVEQEADHLLDHNYDGIQELDNALPPWWKYGFIITIGFAFVYLLHFHVLGNGKNPTEEYQAEMANAQIEKEAFDAKNKDRIDESNVPMANAAGVQNGKTNFLANCVACHGANGEGGVGPNLTDDYWLHKGSLNDIYNTIKKGYPDKGMQSWATKFNPKEMSELASFIKTFKGTQPANGKAQQGDLFIENTAASDSSKITAADSSVTIKK